MLFGLVFVGLAGLSFKRPRGRPKGVPNRLTVFKLLQLKRELLNGATFRKACSDLGMSYNTFKRWRDVVFGDKRFLDGYLAFYSSPMFSSYELDEIAEAFRRVCQVESEPHVVRRVVKRPCELSEGMRRKVERLVDFYRSLFKLTSS